MTWWSDGAGDEPDEFDEFDESSIRSRPNPKGNRPRTKQRPEHADAVNGRILSVDRGRFGVLVRENAEDEAVITASRARELGRLGIVTGDTVHLVGDTSGAEGSLARIVRVDDRKTLLRRSADDSDAVERVIVANADQMLIVVAAANPEPRANLIDRYLIAAFDAGLAPILCITKTDVADPTSFLEQFDCFDLEIIMGAKDDFPLDALKTLLVGHTTVTVGHSGVGKSTLVNALVPGTDRAVGRVNDVTGRGRHTSSSTVCLRVRDHNGDPGWIIDTPGVRSFGLGHVQPANILKSFANYAIPAATLPKSAGGIELSQAHDWEIVDRVSAGELGESGKARLESLQKIITTLEK
ncbi:ribosome small subunit-dependent GTPase A [Subtercola boreus]|uniref:Ribosome small subunit-dependent GTPase A n=1 Tax=Subtercola boreus TaxID=120213 RepID=A0A3E0VQV7_9MICO|nr:ribosome small subunit-dependent GTPase A [Subtercola boreus]RFA11999.1 ribosome small subunit-dependent GTPase A [Subtercola boreus]